MAQLDEVYDANFGGSYTDAKLDRISKIFIILIARLTKYISQKRRCEKSDEQRNGLHVGLH